MRQWVAAILLGGALFGGGNAAYAAAVDGDPWTLPQVIVPPSLGQLQIPPLVPFGARERRGDRGSPPAGTAELAGSRIRHDVLPTTSAPGCAGY